MITGQTITLDEPTDHPCDCMSARCNHTGGRCGAKPARDFALSGWPDSMTLCDACSADMRRLELDLTRDCALCGGPIQRHAVNGRIDGYRGCYCTGRKNRAKNG